MSELEGEYIVSLSVPVTLKVRAESALVARYVSMRRLNSGRVTFPVEAGLNFAIGIPMVESIKAVESEPSGS